ncbi:MAG: SDR family NAD(P)-dependent oxidoreductase, partial [Pirellulales bacterium]
MRIVVTGGAGFIGSHITDHLVAQGHTVVVIDNYSTGRLENLMHLAERITVVEADIARAGPWQAVFEGVDWVIHLAALADIVPSIQNPGDYFRANVDGTFNVLQAARLAGVKRFVYAASSSC